MKNKITMLITMLCSAMLLILCADQAGAVVGDYVYANHEDDGDSYLKGESYNNRVFVACGLDGLRIYNATSYALLESVNDGANYYDVSVSGTCVFVAGGGTGLMCYKLYENNNTLSLNDTVYNITFDEYYSVFAEPGGTYVYAGCGSEGILAYTYDYDAGTLTLAGNQTDDDGSAGYQGIIGTDAFVYVACGGDGLRAYTWDGANFGLYSTVDNSTDNYYDVTWDITGLIYTANGVDGVYVYEDTGTLNLLYNRTDSLGDNYIGIYSNGTVIHFACATEGLRAYSAYNGTSMQYYDLICPSGVYCAGVFGEDPYVFYCANNNGLYWFTFTLTTIVAPTVSTISASSITSTTASLNGLLTSNGGESCTVYFQWGTTIAYGTNTTNQTKTTGESFTASLISLSSGETYHFRAVAVNSNSTVYGADSAFNTTSNLEVNWTGIFDGIGRMFTGGNYTDSQGNDKSVTGIFGGGQDTMALFGLFIFLILFLLTALFGMGILVGSVVIIPSVFAVIGYIPELRVVVAIIAGLIFGMGVNRFVRR